MLYCSETLGLTKSQNNAAFGPRVEEQSSFFGGKPRHQVSWGYCKCVFAPFPLWMVSVINMDREDLALQFSYAGSHGLRTECSDFQASEYIRVDSTRKSGRLSSPWGVIKKTNYSPDLLLDVPCCALRTRASALASTCGWVTSSFLFFWGSSRKSLRHAASNLVANKELRAETISSGNLLKWLVFFCARTNQWCHNNMNTKTVCKSP